MSHASTCFFTVLNEFRQHCAKAIGGAVRGARAVGATWQAWAFSSARALFQDGRARLALQRQNKNVDDLFNVLAREAMMRFLFALP